MCKPHARICSSFQSGLAARTHAGSGIRAPGSGGPKQTRFCPSLLTEPEGRDRGGGETRTEFISARPAPDDGGLVSQKTVSELLTVLPDLYKENVGERLGARRSHQSLSWSQSRVCGGLAGSEQSLLLEGVVWVPIRGCSALMVLGLSREASWREEPN